MTGPDSPLFWPDEGPPRSRHFDDLYFSAEDGLAEARAVFLAGCGLPDAWRGRRRFCVGELGFGTGLNIAALLELWRREGPADARLSIFSVEAYPLAWEDAGRALTAWPELGQAARALHAHWPGAARGFRRIDLPGFRATLDLAVMEAGEALAAWRGQADAWFLDGFAPARNPLMWRPEVLDLVGRRSAPGARLATYSAAGEVRRGLAAAGFEVRRVPGFAGKRHRLEAAWPGVAPARGSVPRAAIVGAGIAGQSLARAFAAEGVEAFLLASGQPAAGPAALVASRLDAGLGPPAALFAQALARAARLYAAHPGVVLGEGALQLAVGLKDPARFAAIAESDLFEAGEMTVLDAAAASERTGEPTPPALFMAGARVVDPAAIRAAWIADVKPAEVGRLERTEAGAWRLVDAADEIIAEADVVCLAAGMASAALAPGLASALALRPVRGQASFAPGAGGPGAILFGGYVVATPGGVLFGATHDRDDVGLEARVGDHRRNLEVVAEVLPRLAGRLAAAPLDAFVGVRATTPDFLPVAGEISPGLLVLAGLGSRGFTLAPLLAEQVVALALGAPSPLPGPLAALLDPGRFERRARRRAEGRRDRLPRRAGAGVIRR